MPTKTPEWEQRDDESAPAYTAFKHYRDDGDKRSYVSTAEALGKSRTLIERWAFQYAWQARVRSHTRSLEHDATKQRQKRYKQMYDMQAGIASMLLKKAVDRLKEIDPGELSVMEALKFVKLGVDIEREARAFNIHDRASAPEDAARSTANRIATINENSPK
jgi:hypothetical protein